MVTVIRVQILNEARCNSQSVNNPEKEMNPSILPLWINSRTSLFFNIGIAAGLEAKPVKLLLKTD